MNIVETIINKDFDQANNLIEEKMTTILERKMYEVKRMCGAKISEQDHDERMKRLRMDVLEDNVEENLLKIGKRRVKLTAPSKRANQEQRPNLVSNLEEEVEQLDEAPRVGIVKARIRGGKVQRRKRVSNVPGMTIRGGKLTRMSAAERRRRKLGAKKAARKSKAKKSQMLRKRKMSLMKRARLGI